MSNQINDTLTQLESIDAIAEAEAGILSCLSQLLYKPTSPNDPTPTTPSLLFNLYQLLKENSTILPLTPEIASLITQLILSYACKEFAVADIINALACKLAVAKDIIKHDKEDRNVCCFN
ncbi:hypothetical protein ABG79_00396 [Caloramator mitchellensis]|uniref:Uncharacterized protein n=1 Tax=Caloramator mitchellensis TaxID=908809 RepID=A0A0R3JVG5_CALMK|nr:hypothetical protein [Caloramator mitchellensis]KRQ87595.1 hypothetical protein ABG79_00396 [Caloramator mitchellensis]